MSALHTDRAVQRATPTWAGGPATRAAAAGLVLAGFALRVWNLAGQSLWYDEAYSVWLASGPLAGVVQRIVTLDNHPPLYTLALHWWVALAGSSEFAVRWLSAGAGALSVAALWRLGLRLGGAPGGLAAAGLAAASPFYVYYGQEARAYAFALLWGALSLDAAVACLQSSRRDAWLRLALATVLGLYTHYAAALLTAALAATLGVHGLVAWARGAGLAALQRPAVVGGAVALALGPWVPVAFAAVGRDRSYYEGSLPVLPLFSSLLGGFAGALERLGAPDAGAPVFAWVLGALAAAGAALAWRRPGVRWPLAALSIAVLVPVVAYAGLQHLVPKFHPRYLMAATPALYALAGIGLAGLWALRPAALGRGIALVAAAVLTAGWWGQLAGYYGGSLAAREDWRAVAAYLHAARGPQDPVVVLSGYGQLPLTYYLGEVPVIPLPNTLLPLVDRSVTLDDVRALGDALLGHPTAWLVEWQPEVMDPAGQVEAALVRSAEVADDRTLGGVRVRALRLRDPLAAPAAAGDPTATFAGVIALERVALPQGPQPSGDALRLGLHWRALAQPERNYKVAVTLLDAARHEWGRVDARPAGELNVTRRWAPGASFAAELALPVAAGAPPGAYALELQLYDEETLAPLPATAGGKASPLVPLGTVQVAGRPHSLDQLGPLTPADVPGPLRLLGYRGPQSPVPAGEAVTVTLGWEVAEPGAPPQVRLRAGSEEAVGPALPGTGWRLAQPGDRFVTLHTVPTPPEASGSLDVTLSVGDAPPFAVPVHLLGRPIVTAPPPVAVPAGARFGDVTLYGYALSPAEALPGDTVALRLVWRCDARPLPRLKVFVHLLDAAGQVVTQRDTEPAEGALPTHRWAAGEYVEDLHRLRLPAQLPPGTYTLRVGLYAWPDGARLPLAGGGDALDLAASVRITAR